MTASPATSAPWWTTSPRCIPILRVILRSGAAERFASFRADWISTAQLTASRALANSTRKASPMVFTSLPSCLARTGRISLLCSSTRASESDSLVCPMAVNPTMSVNIMAASLRCPCDKLARGLASPADKSVMEALGVPARRRTRQSRRRSPNIGKTPDVFAGAILHIRRRTHSSPTVVGRREGFEGGCVTRFKAERLPPFRLSCCQATHQLGGARLRALHG